MRKIVMLVLGLLLLPMMVGAVEQGQAVVREIYFDLDKADIRPDAIPTLREIATIMREYPNLGIALSGYTCDLATNEYNERLARRRADAALNWLVANERIERSRVLDSSYGEERPAYPNDTEENRRKNRRVLITLTVPRAAPAPPAPPVPQPVIRSVTTSVLDAAGNFIPDLPNGNFTVTVNGENKEIVRVTQQMERQRGTLGLLLDNSYSNCLIDLRDASREFLGLRNADDRVILMTVNDNVDLLSDLSHDRSGQLQLVNGLTRQGCTRLYDGICEAVNSHLAGQNSPRYLMVISDGVDEGKFLEARGSVRTLDNAIAAAKQAGVKVFTVELGPTWPEGTTTLKRLAAETGGKYMVWDVDANAMQFAEIYRALGSGLRGAYTIEYRIMPQINAEAVVGSSAGRVQSVR